MKRIKQPSYFNMEKNWSESLIDTFHQRMSIMPRPGDYYESAAEIHRINKKTWLTWRETYLIDLATWEKFRKTKNYKGKIL